jgi:hypothetical protein
LRFVMILLSLIFPPRRNDLGWKGFITGGPGYAYPSSMPEHGGSLILLWVPEGILSAHPSP